MQNRGTIPNNINPKLRKRYKNLNWYFDAEDKYVEELPSNRLK